MIPFCDFTLIIYISIYCYFHMWDMSYVNKHSTLVADFLPSYNCLYLLQILFDQSQTSTRRSDSALQFYVQYLMMMPCYIVAASEAIQLVGNIFLAIGGAFKRKKENIHLFIHV